MSLLLTTLRQNELANISSSALLGMTVPRVLMARTPEEKFDVLTYEAGAHGGFFVVGLLLDKLTDRLFRPAFRAGGQSSQWARFGKSGAVLSVLSGTLYAVPYFRDWLTAKKTHQVDFRSVIRKPAGGKPTALSKKSFDERTQWFLDRARQSLAVGFAIAATLTGVSLLAIRGKVPWEKLNIPLKALSPILGREAKNQSLGDWINKNILFAKHPKTGKYAITKMPRFSQFVFWGTIPYVGVYNASRDTTERRETVIKWADFIASFFILPHFVEFLGPKALQLLKTKGKNPQETIQNAKFITNFVTRIAALTLSTVYYQHQTNQKLATPLSESLNSRIQNAFTLAPPSPITGQPISTTFSGYQAPLSEFMEKAQRDR